MKNYYILDGHEVVKSDLMTWARWLEITKNRHVAREAIGEADISTVFLGLDHSFGQGPPLLFETMIFGLEGEEPQWRYSTWEEAEAGHVRALEYARNALQVERPAR